MIEKTNTKEQIFQRILDAQEQLGFYGVKNIGLFGSFVRGDQTPMSDIDILVEFTPEKHTFDASKKLPEDVKAMQPDIEWRKVTGMRDRLIHDYFGVDYTLVWDVATTKLPDLRSKIQTLLDAREKCQPKNAPDPKSRAGD